MAQKVYASDISLNVTDSGLPINQMVVLDDESCPLELQECQPEGETKFHLKMRSGGLIMVRTSTLTSGVSGVLDQGKPCYTAR